jgi:hypothetical protein
MKYDRLLKPDKHRSSAFILGPRMTGKTFLLQEIPAEKYYDLLDPQTELAFRHHPETFGQEILALPPGVTVIVDDGRVAHRDRPAPVRRRNPSFPGRRRCCFIWM